MSKNIKVAGAVINQTPLDWEGNTRRIIEVLSAARADGVELVLLPELVLCGYGCEDAFFNSGVEERCLEALDKLLPHTNALVTTLTLPLRHKSTLYNCVCVVADGKIVGVSAKRELARTGVHYEPRWFSAWQRGVADSVTLLGSSYPFGDLIYDISGVKIGLEICEEAWTAKRPGEILAQHGVDIILNPSASHFAFGKFEQRKKLVREGASCFKAAYLYANLLGNESGKMIYDGGVIIAHRDGMIASLGPRFSYEEWKLTTAILAIRPVEKVDVIETPPHIKSKFVFKGTNSVPQTNYPQDTWESSPELKHEEFARAVSLGLFDYLRKSHSRGFVVSLSGGADSAAVICLVSLMVSFALKELGVERFLKKIGREKGDFSALDQKSLMQELLTCVYQASNFSGEVTKHAAREVAKEIGARFIEWSIAEEVSGYQNLVEKALGEQLSWKEHDVALQNVQARVRVPGVWLIANIKRALLLVTSNRSEASVGYATMDGDSSGSLAPIGGIDKHYLRIWLTWLEKNSPQDASPLPALSFINAQQPTAELRPISAHQTDEADLMPYEILNLIEEAFLVKQLTPLAIYTLLVKQKVPYANAQLVQWITKFFTLWTRNQWKRERFAPAFHLDDHSVDPRSWCRFPILSSGFVAELRELELKASEVQ